MEYDFIREKNGQYSVELSMDHEVLAQWINTELGHHTDRIRAVLSTISQVKKEGFGEKRMTGCEYSICLTAQEAEISANSIHFKHNDLSEQLAEDHLSEDDSLSQASCGTDDLQFLLEDWLDFVQS